MLSSASVSSHGLSPFCAVASLSILKEIFLGRILRFSDCGSARGTVSRTFNGVLSRTQGELAVIISTVSSIRTDLRPDFRSSDVQFVRGSKDSVVLVSIATNTYNNYEE